tara:strand:+ start:36 stop:479 length:444 start_codon:yes stop_codon:yes gene_type:complete
MADDATITFSATILPDEISKALTSLSAGYTPADATEKWYYKNTTVSNTSTILISGSFISEEAIGTAHDTITAGTDIVKFLYIKNNGSNTVYLTLDGTTVTTSSRDAIIIPNGKAWFGQLQCEVEELLAITNTGTSVCDVAAIIDDVP